MALTLLAANNAQTVLAAGISSSATSLTVNTGTGTLFPAPVSGTSYFKLTLIDAATGTITEIVHVTARVGDVFTIQRAREGTTARAWSANDIAANMMTAGTLDVMAQKDLSLQVANNLSEIKTAGITAQVEAQLNLGMTPRGQVSFSSSASFTVPDGVYKIYASGCGGGGGGGGGGGNPTTGSSGGGGGGGGAGNIAINQSVTVVPGQTYTVTIGARGNGGANSGSSGSDGKNGTAGGTTSFGSLLTLSGGGAGLGGVSGGNPSPGGGFGGAPGGSDGGDGNFTTAVATGNGGVGASGPFGVNGGRGRSGTPGRSGYAATGYGTGGGGGGGSYGSGGGIGAAGGNGSPGILIVRW
ncbi:hypothetical protein V5080_03450 [Atlantibacter hermannii]|uniref:glycine-rich domain-containing protein n=1 Tax=Atlantibacter hermannii TaxID=565 RepID=UPI0030760100